MRQLLGGAHPLSWGAGQHTGGSQMLKVNDLMALPKASPKVLPSIRDDQGSSPQHPNRPATVPAPPALQEEHCKRSTARGTRNCKLMVACPCGASADEPPVRGFPRAGFRKGFDTWRAAFECLS